MIEEEKLRAAAEASLDAYTRALEAEYDRKTSRTGFRRFRNAIRGFAAHRERHLSAIFRLGTCAAMLLLVALMGSGIWMSSDAMAAAARSGWAKVKAEYYTSYHYRKDEDTGVNQYSEPTWVPDDYSLLLKEDTGNLFHAIYISERRGMLSFSCTYGLGAEDVFLRSQNAETYLTTVGGYTAELLHFESNDDSDAIVWTDYSSVYVISGNLTQEELIKMANSLYQK